LRKARSVNSPGCAKQVDRQYWPVAGSTACAASRHRCTSGLQPAGPPCACSSNARLRRCRVRPARVANPLSITSPAPSRKAR
jgi:hypothetical protein